MIIIITMTPSKNRRDIRYKIRKNAVNGTIDGTESLLK